MNYDRKRDLLLVLGCTAFLPVQVNEQKHARGHDKHVGIPKTNRHVLMDTHNHKCHRQGEENDVK